MRPRGVLRASVPLKALVDEEFVQLLQLLWSASLF